MLPDPTVTPFVRRQQRENVARSMPLRNDPRHDYRMPVEREPTTFQRLVREYGLGTGAIWVCAGCATLGVFSLLAVLLDWLVRP